MRRPPPRSTRTSTPLPNTALFRSPTTSADESADDPVEPVDFSGRGPYAVGTVDLQVGSEHTIAVFYPVDPADVAADAEPYSYDGEDVLDPAIAALLPAALSDRKSTRLNSSH